MKITSALKTYDDEATAEKPFALDVDETEVTFFLEDGVVNGRAVKIELTPAGELNVLLYPKNMDEPVHMQLDAEGNCKRID